MTEMAGEPGLVRTLVVWCLDWPVVAAGLPVEDPVAVVSTNRVVAASAAARAEGVARGQRRREAQGRCPGLTVVDRDPARETRLFEPVLVAIESLAPRVEVTRAGTCLVPTRGPSRYFGGDEALAGLIRSRVGEVLAERTECRIGVADGPFAAGLAARHGTAARTGAHVVDIGATPTFLAPFPLTVLEQPDLTDVLHRLGLRCLGDLAGLPAPDVLGRFGEIGDWAHRLAAGKDDRPPAARRPPPEMAVTVELDPPAEQLDRVAFAARGLAEALHERLGARGLAATRVEVLAETDHGEELVRVWRHEGALSAGAVADRVRWQLDAWLDGPPTVRPSAGLIRLTLTPLEVVPATGRQLGFWGGETAADERAARALARVESLLGTDSVKLPEHRGGREPADRVGLVPLGALDVVDRGQRLGQLELVTERERSPWPGALPTPSPTVCHPEPIPVQVVDAAGAPVRVDGRGEVSGVPARVSVAGAGWQLVEGWAGPWPIEERWWDPRRHRRRARFQVVCGTEAHLLVQEAGMWWLIATY